MRAEILQQNPHCPKVTHHPETMRQLQQGAAQHQPIKTRKRTSDSTRVLG
jgi:hypothetical protein